jgi:transcriptional repressor NrdR
MRCPDCGSEEDKVIDSRATDDGREIRRRRECLDCGARFTTYETVRERPIIVLKSDKSREPFDRQKLLRGLLRATVKRDVPAARLDELIDDVMSALRDNNRYEIPSRELGEMVLERLRDVDDVAYIRFASVYRDFQSIQEFKTVLEGMAAEEDAL